MHVTCNSEHKECRHFNSAWTVMIGKTILHYRILEKLGEGGMGIVYSAEDTKLGRRVALKFLPPELTRDPEAKERFINEARAASALDHPNICNIHDIDETGEGRIFISMACYEGDSLKKIVAKGPLSVPKAVNIAFQIAQGLSSAHERGITHRDIKPANIIITRQGTIKILDFGLAKLAGQVNLTKIGTTIGTAAYMSPEQSSGRDVDHRTDIWSLGVVLYEMLCGHPPFKGDYEQAIIYSILNEQPEPVGVSRADVPPGLENILSRCLAKNPEERYDSVIELIGDLVSLQSTGETGTVMTPVADDGGALSGRVEGGGRLSSGRGKIIISSVIVILVIISGFLWKKGVIRPRGGEGTPVAAVDGTGEKTDPGKSGVGIETSGDMAGDMQERGRARQDQFENSIVVIPFEDISPGSDNEYFSDGLTEEIIADLSRIRSLRVISRTSAMKLKGIEKDIGTIGREMNVHYALEGSVRKVDTELRITAQLIDTKTDAHIWAEKYDGTLEDVLEIQEKVSRAIVDALKLRLSPDEADRIALHPIEDPRAYEYYFRAKQEVSKVTEEALGKAIDYLRAGLDIVGDNVLLFQGLGYTYWQYINLGLRVDDDYLDIVQQYASKIFEIEPDSPRGHVLLGLIGISRGEKQSSVFHFKKVIEADPNDADALRWLFLVYSYSGSFDAAERIGERLTEVDPFYKNRAFAWLYFMKGDFARARDAALEYREKERDNVSMELLYVLLLSYAGNMEEFYAGLDDLCERIPDHTVVRVFRFFRYASLGQREEAMAILTPDLEIIGKRDWQYASQIGSGFAMLGDAEKAVEWLGNAADMGFINYPFLAEYDPFLESIREEESFKKLMVRVKREWEEFED